MAVLQTPARGLAQSQPETPRHKDPARLIARLLPEKRRELPDRAPCPPPKDRPLKVAGTLVIAVSSGDWSLSAPATGKMPATAGLSGARSNLPFF